VGDGKCHAWTEFQGDSVANPAHSHLCLQGHRPLGVPVHPLARTPGTCSRSSDKELSSNLEASDCHHTAVPYTSIFRKSSDFTSKEMALPNWIIYNCKEMKGMQSLPPFTTGSSSAG
jgi:hypothetical protein